MRAVYIDGDVLPYEIGFVTQRKVYQLDSEGLHTCSPSLVTKAKNKVNRFIAADTDLLMTEFFYEEEPMQVINTLRQAIVNIVRASGVPRFKVVLSGKTNFRDRVAKIQPYKENRKGKDKPVHFDMVREWLLDKPYTIVSEDEEADDVISRAMMAGHIGATPDKDLKNTPGHIYNWKRKEHYHVSESDARRNFYTQCLVGDTADNIPGARGIGPARAAKLLAGCETDEEYESAVLETYEGLYDNPYEALVEIGQLLWMRREEEELWLPTTSQN